HLTAGGVTWDHAPTTLGWHHDHPAVAVDLTSPRRKGWIYITSHHEVRDGNAQPTSSVFVARSRDGGKTFEEQTIPSSTNLHIFSEMPIVFRDGTIDASFVGEP